MHFISAHHVHIGLQSVSATGLTKTVPNRTFGNLRITILKTLNTLWLSSARVQLCQIYNVTIE